MGIYNYFHYMDIICLCLQMFMCSLACLLSKIKDSRFGTVNALIRRQPNCVYSVNYIANFTQSILFFLT